MHGNSENARKPLALCDANLEVTISGVLSENGEKEDCLRSCRPAMAVCFFASF